MAERERRERSGGGEAEETKGRGAGEEEVKAARRCAQEKKSGRKVSLHGAHLVFPAVVFISRTGETFRSVVRAIPGADFLRGS